MGYRANSRKPRPKLKVGICGEHGGDLDSVNSATRSEWITSAPRHIACRFPAWVPLKQ